MMYGIYLKNNKYHDYPSQHSMLGHHRPASGTPFEWRFAGGPMVARLQMFTGMLPLLYFYF